MAYSNLKFSVDDEVVVVDSFVTGVVKQVLSVLGPGNNVYLVSINGKNRIFAEKDLAFSYKNELNRINSCNISSLIEIEDEIYYLFDKLGLIKSDDYVIQFTNALKLQKYLASRNFAEKDNKCFSNDITIKLLFDGIVNQKNDNITLAVIFQKILAKLGMNVLIVAVADEKKHYYLTNLVLIGEFYYYFDISWERILYLNNNSDNFELCCAALGSKNYKKFYHPLGIVNYINHEFSGNLPSNIAYEDLKF